MSSETSTSEPARAGARTSHAEPEGLQPWQFFVLAGLGCATALAYIAAGRGVSSIVLLTSLMAAAALVGMAALRMLRPLVSAETDRTAAIGQRARAALEREKLLTLRSIKELEFDRAMGKLSESDWREMSTRLRARAAGLIRRLDAGADYRSQIEAEVAKRLGSKSPAEREASSGAEAQSAKAAADRLCGSCSTVNDHDAKFCKSCGHKL